MKSKLLKCVIGLIVFIDLTIFGMFIALFILDYTAYHLRAPPRNIRNPVITSDLLKHLLWATASKVVSVLLIIAKGLFLTKKRELMD